MTETIICKKNKWINILPLVMAVAYVLLLFILRKNYLVVISVAFSIFTGIFTTLTLLFKKKINIYFILSYFVFMGGSFLFYVIFGAESFGQRLLNNLMLTIIPLALNLMLLLYDKIFKNKWKKILPVIISIILVGTSMFYFVAMNIKIKPTVKSLQKGHDEYLKGIKDSVKSNAPNVLIILTDDLAYSDLSSYSYLGSQNATIKTPNIDSIADDGIMMTNFYSSSPVCSPSRFGMLTGRYPSRGYLDNVIFPSNVSLAPFGITRYFNPFQFKNNVDGILGDEITFAEVLQSAGYNTGLIGKWNLGDYGQYLPTNQGFDYFYGSHYVNDMTPYNMVREVNGKAEEVFTHQQMKDQSGTTALLTKELNGFIEKSVDNDEKFFAYYTTPWPHSPIYSGEVNNKTDDNYIDCIQEFDTYLGQTLQMLKDKGVYDDTLIIFTSDNGPGKEGVSGALRGRKNTAFDGGHKVPLLASYKNGGLGQGENLDGNKLTSMSMNIDIFPTVLSYVGIDTLPTDRAIDGKNLFALWQGEIGNNPQIHDELYFIKRGNVQGVNMRFDVNAKPVDFKFYEKIRTENSAFIDQVYKNYLFNLSNDPAEGYNISMKHPEIASVMKQKIHDFTKELKVNRRGVK